jgi:uncharacterized iron-regulated protein
MCALVTGLAGCAGPSPPALVLTQPVVLLGEVHDNAAQHELRLSALRARLATGARPALLMEQIDRDRQRELDALLEREPLPDARAVVSAVGARGWNWGFYKPFIELALEHRLPVVAANISREEARRVMREGLAAAGFDAAAPEPLLRSVARQIEDSHCGVLDAATARRMALAQVARDQTMAQLVQRYAGRGVVLLAGNGHVRTDTGAPRWLDAATRARSEAIGLVEEGDDGRAPFDRRIVTVKQPRPDPCEGLRQRPPARVQPTP